MPGSRNSLVLSAFGSLIIAPCVRRGGSGFCSLLGLTLLLPLRLERERRYIAKPNFLFYHISFISLLCIFGEYLFYQPFRKARAVCRWPSPPEKVGMRLFLQHPLKQFIYPFIFISPTAWFYKTMIFHWVRSKLPIILS